MFYQLQQKNFENHLSWAWLRNSSIRGQNQEKLNSVSNSGSTAGSVLSDYMKYESGSIFKSQWARAGSASAQWYLEIILLTWSTETLEANNPGSKAALFKEYQFHFERKVPLLLLMVYYNVSSLLVGGENLPYLH